MKNNTRRWLASACAFALMANGALGVTAQERRQQVEKVETRHFIQQDGKTVTVESNGNGNTAFNFRMTEPGAVWAMTAGQEIGLEGSTFQFFSSEMSFDTRDVKGAPFSAETVSETVQTLADGNRIVQRTEGRSYRDSQGRTRQERTFKMGGSNTERQMITIFDPVANVTLTLDPQSRTARKMNTFKRVPPPPLPPPAATVPQAAGETPKKISVSGGVLQGAALKKVQPPYPPIAKAARASGSVQVQILVNETGEVTEASVISGHPLLRDAALEAAKQWQFKPTELSGNPVKVQGVLTFNFTLGDENPPPPFEGVPGLFAGSIGIVGGSGAMKVSTNTEKIGKQMIEGVECEGTRAVLTLPAGAIGNENPIQTVHESWYSPELKMTIMTKRTDPRFGESTYRMTNIVRAEPDATLFQVPNDYTVTEGAAYNFNAAGQSGFGFGAATGTGELPRKKAKPDQQ